MDTWFSYLRRGLYRRIPEDRLAAPDGCADTYANLRNLRPFVTRHWPRGLLGALLLLLSSLLVLPQPLVTRYLIDDVILSRQLDLLLGAAFLLATLKVSALVTDQAQHFLFTRFEQEVLLDIQHELLDRTLHFPKSFFDDKEVGYLMSRLLSDVQGLRWFFSSTLVYIVSNFLRFAGGTLFLFYLQWRLAIVALIIIPVMVVAVWFFSRRIRVLSHEGMEQRAHISHRMQESLSASSLIKAFASEGREAERVTAELRAAFQIALERVAVGSLANLTITGMGDVAKFAVLIVGAYLVIVGQWTLGSLLAFQAYLGYVFGPAQYLASTGLQLQDALAALERVSALFDIVPEGNLGTGKRVGRLRGEIEFRNVSFSYDGGKPVLKDVSCCIHPGERVAIVGPSGVGKTTLLSLILRFYRPTTGEIWFDGLPASEYEVSSLRERIGYVSQSSLLLSGTIGENLLYGNPDAGQEEMNRAARVAGIHNFIADLPGGYDAPVGERGVNLSEGQKQRLAIARALIKDPDILVLDEPASALDSVVERSIFDALPAMVRDKTLFVVAHRLATVQNSDRILLLNDKRLVAIGTHRELLAQSGYYRSLVQNQQIVAPIGEA